MTGTVVLVESLKHIFYLFSACKMMTKKYSPSLILWKRNPTQPASPEEGEIRRTPINPITDREDLRMSTYQVRFKNTSEEPVLKKQRRKTKEEKARAPCAEQHY